MNRGRKRQPKHSWGQGDEAEEEAGRDHSGLEDLGGTRVSHPCDGATRLPHSFQKDSWDTLEEMMHVAGSAWPGTK